MRTRAVHVVALLALLGLVFSHAPTASADPPFHETGFIEMSDGVRLHYKVMLPDEARFGAGPYPTVIDYSGYVPALNVYDGLDDRFLAAGYAVVGLNIRGTACSGGTFDYFEPRQSLDGVEAIDWLAEQPWSNGRFGMVGKSYPGITQLFVAGASSPDPDQQAWIDQTLADHLAAIVPGHVFSDLYRDVPFPGGIMNVTFAGAWSANRYHESYAVGPQYFLGIGDGEVDGDVPDEVREECLANQADHAANPVYNPFTQAVANQYDGPLFRERSPYWFADEIATPLFLVQSWQDEQVGSRAVHLLEQLPETTSWKFLGTNGDHGEYYGPEVFPRILEFLSHHLPPAGGAIDAQAAEAFAADDDVTILWENGAERATRWTTTHGSWPLPEVEPWRLTLTADGRLTDAPHDDTGFPTRVEAVNAALAESVSYAYAPEVGSQQRGGYDLTQDQPPPASWDDRPPPGTSASFTTEPLADDALLAGTASLDLWLSSTAPDTDLEVTLSEVRPDGQEVFVQQGWLRASHRLEDSARSTALRPFQSHRLGDTTPLVAGQPTELRVEIFPFAHAFRAGSRVRVTVAAPHAHPDLWGFAALPAPAVNTIHTASTYPSSLALPLLSGAVAGVETLPDCTLRNQPCRIEPSA